MALSPNAPDYISQVRGVIGDLRDNYLKKQQLFQQNEQAKAQTALGYAQLAAQRDNASLDAQYKNRVLEQNAIQEEAKNEALLRKAELDARKEQYAAYKDAVAQNLNQKKYELDVGTEARNARKEADDLARKKASGARMAEYMKLAANKDYDGIRQWYSDAEKDSFDLLDYQTMIANAKNITDGIEGVSNQVLVQNALPDLNKFHSEAEVFQNNMESLSSSERDKGVAEFQKRASIFGTNLRDKQTTDSLAVTLASIQNTKKEVEDRAEVRAQDEFRELAKRGELEPAVQKKYADLKTRTPEEQRSGEDWDDALLALRLENNKIDSAQKLALKAKELALYEENQLKNPNFTVTNPDGTVRAAFQAPNLTPSYKLGVLDKDNKISKQTEDAIKDYENKVRTVGIMKQDTDPLLALGSVIAEAEARREASKSGKPYVPVTPTTPNAAQNIDMSKARFSNQWAMTPATPQNASPVAGQQTTPASPETVPTAQPQAKSESPDYQRSVAVLNDLKRQKAENKKFVQSYDPTKKSYIDYINPKTNRPVSLDLMIAKIENDLANLRVATFSPENPTPFGILTPTQQPIGLQPVELMPASTISPTEQ
jgi:hypothetical protein